MGSCARQCNMTSPISIPPRIGIEPRPAQRVPGALPLRILDRPVSSAPSIYLVDDEAQLTGLYTLLLEAEGFLVTSFNDRAKALAALKAQNALPDLLITDYSGLAMPVGEFLQQ